MDIVKLFEAGMRGRSYTLVGDEFQIQAARWKAGQKQEVTNEAVDCFGWDADIREWLRSYNVEVHNCTKDIVYNGPYTPTATDSETVRQAVAMGFND